jgi:hypothetical protein
MALTDDPAFLRRPLGFAIGINTDDDLDVSEGRRRLPGLLKFVRTFAGELLEKEFDTAIAGFPLPARDKVAALSTRLKRAGSASRPARRLMETIVDILDLEIDRDETYDGDDDEGEDEYLDEILILIDRLLERFEGWIDGERLPRLAGEAKRACREFAAASKKLSS